MNKDTFVIVFLIAMVVLFMILGLHSMNRHGEMRRLLETLDDSETDDPKSSSPRVCKHCGRPIRDE